MFTLFSEPGPLCSSRPRKASIQSIRGPDQTCMYAIIVFNNEGNYGYFLCIYSILNTGRQQQSFNTAGTFIAGFVNKSTC